MVVLCADSACSLCRARAWERRSTAGCIGRCHLRSRRGCLHLQLLLHEGPLPLRHERTLASGMVSPAFHPPSTAKATKKGQVKTTEIFLARMSQSRTAANAGLSIHTYMRTRSTWKKNAMSTNGHYPTHGNCKLGCPQTTTTRIIIPHEVKKKKQSTCSSR